MKRFQLPCYSVGRILGVTMLLWVWNQIDVYVFTAVGTLSWTELMFAYANEMAFPGINFPERGSVLFWKTAVPLFVACVGSCLTCLFDDSKKLFGDNPEGYSVQSVFFLLLSWLALYLFVVFVTCVLLSLSSGWFGLSIGSYGVAPWWLVLFVLFLGAVLLLGYLWKLFVRTIGEGYLKQFIILTQCCVIFVLGLGSWLVVSLLGPGGAREDMRALVLDQFPRYDYGDVSVSLSLEGKQDDVGTVVESGVVVSTSALVEQEGDVAIYEEPVVDVAALLVEIESAIVLTEFGNEMFALLSGDARVDAFVAAGRAFVQEQGEDAREDVLQLLSCFVGASDLSYWLELTGRSTGTSKDDFYVRYMSAICGRYGVSVYDIDAAVPSGRSKVAVLHEAIKQFADVDWFTETRIANHYAWYVNRLFAPSIAVPYRDGAFDFYGEGPRYLYYYHFDAVSDPAVVRKVQGYRDEVYHWLYTRPDNAMRYTSPGVYDGWLLVGFEKNVQGHYRRFLHERECGALLSGLDRTHIYGNHEVTDDDLCIYAYFAGLLDGSIESAYFDRHLALFKEEVDARFYE